MESPLLCECVCARVYARVYVCTLKSISWTFFLLLPFMPLCPKSSSTQSCGPIASCLRIPTPESPVWCKFWPGSDTWASGLSVCVSVFGSVSRPGDSSYPAGLWWGSQSYCALCLGSLCLLNPLSVLVIIVPTPLWPVLSGILVRKKELYNTAF